jgi:integrase
MSRRSGQQGNVVKKGNAWHGRYYVDVVGQDERKRVSVPLGSTDSMTKPEAKRRLRAMLEENGINTEAHFIRTTRPGRSFAEEAEWWKDNRLSLFKPSCQETMGGHIDKYLLPRFGQLSLDSIEERQVQEFIAQLNRTEYLSGRKRKRLSPKSIRNIIGVLKLILGGKVWREWKLSLPESPVKEQRYFTPAEMLQIINAATGQWKPLFATLASTGLRAGEAFGLHVEDLDLSAGRIFVRRSIWRGQEVTVKTKRGYRVVNIELALAEMLKQHLKGRVSGRVFQTTKGTPFSKDGVRRKLQTILRKLGLEKGGLHAFRHGRVSILQANGVPGDLVKEWVGHSSLRTTSRYTHFRDEYRQQVVNEVGLLSGNRKENCSDGPNGPKFSAVAAESKVA